MNIKKHREDYMDSQLITESQTKDKILFFQPEETRRDSKGGKTIYYSNV